MQTMKYKEDFIDACSMTYLASKCDRVVSFFLLN